MRILTRDEIRAVENRAFDGLFTEAQLMERAGGLCCGKMLALSRRANERTAGGGGLRQR